jgi:hypothetical protein
MLYGLSKIAVLGGHGDGENAIPSEFAATAALRAYREGTAMHKLADAISNATGIQNLRTEATDLSWKERALRAKAAGADLAVELHTNWSTNSAGKPNGGVFVVIVAMHNPVHDTDAQKDMATQLFKPLAEAMGMTFQLRTKNGTGGGHDWYSFINQCNVQGIPYPMIVEHGYHIDYASDEDKYRQLIVKRYREICELSMPGTITETISEGAIDVDETETNSYIVHAGAYLSRDNGADEWIKVKEAGYTSAYWWKNSDGVYHLRTGRYNTLAYAMAEAEKLAGLGLQAGVVII